MSDDPAIRVQEGDDGRWGLALPPPVVEFIDWAEFFDREHAEHEWVFEDVLAKGRLHSMYAKGGLGKSLFTLWMSTRIVANGGVVLYCDYEMSEEDLYERLVDMGMDSPEALNKLRYLLLPNLPPMNTPEGGDALMHVVASVQHEFPGDHITIVIDTIGRAVRGEENSNDTIQDWYRHTGMAIKRGGHTCIRLDHSGHEGSHQRGGSAKRDDVDIIWRLELADEGIILKSDKGRMGWVPESVSFRKVTDPVLTYRIIPVAWPLGTEALARALDDAGVPLGASRRVCRAAMAERNISGSNETIGHAQRFRAHEARMLAERGWSAYIDNSITGTEPMEEE